MTAFLRLRSPLMIVVLGLVLAVADAAMFSPAPAARAVVVGGGPTIDALEVSAEVSVESILGTETISLTGSAVLERSAPRAEGGVEVADVEISSFDLTGTSVTGPVVIRQSPTLASVGETRGLQPSPDQFPASSFIDVFFEADVPGSPSDPITLHNVEALHLVPTDGGSEVPLAAWPPDGVTFHAAPDPCKPLLPVLPGNVCVTSASFTVGESLPPPTPTPTATLVPTPGPTPTATLVPTPGATPTPTPTFVPGDAQARLDPATQSVNAGEAVVVDVHVTAVADLAAYEIEIPFDPELLSFVSVENGSFLGSSGRTQTCLGPLAEALELGTVFYGCATSGSGPGAFGGGLLASVTFRAACTAGEATLDLVVDLVEPFGEPIPAQASGGDVSITGECPTPTPSPTNTVVPPTLTQTPTGPTPTATPLTEVLGLPVTGVGQPSAGSSGLPGVLATVLATGFGLVLLGLGVRRFRRS